MYNPMTAPVSPSLRRFGRKCRDFMRYVIPEIFVIAAAVMVLLTLIDRFFFRR